MHESNEFRIPNNLVDFHIPPYPENLLALQQEIKKENADLKLISRIISKDVALSIALLASANSPVYGLRRKCESIDQAINFLGVKQIAHIFMVLLLRKVIKTEGPNLARFWDVSSKRSHAMNLLARRFQFVDFSFAQTFGMFCDVGIPIMMQKFPDYGTTLSLCNSELSKKFTDLEDLKYGSNHAYLGSLMARSWGLSPTVYTAIRYHHDYSQKIGGDISSDVLNLIALCLIAEISIQRFAGMNNGSEWIKGAEFSISQLAINDEIVEECIELVINSFIENNI